MKENSLSVFVCKNPFEGLQSTHKGLFWILKVQLEVKISQDCGNEILLQGWSKILEKIQNRPTLHLEV